MKTRHRAASGKPSKPARACTRCLNWLATTLVRLPEFAGLVLVFCAKCARLIKLRDSAPVLLGGAA